MLLSVGLFVAQCRCELLVGGFLEASEVVSLAGDSLLQDRIFHFSVVQGFYVFNNLLFVNLYGSVILAAGVVFLNDFCMIVVYWPERLVKLLDLLLVLLSVVVQVTAKFLLIVVGAQTHSDS